MRNYFYDSNRKILGYIEDNVICDTDGRIKGHIHSDGTISDSNYYGKILGHIDNPNIVKKEDAIDPNSTSIPNSGISEVLGMSLLMILMVVLTVLVWPAFYNVISRAAERGDTREVLAVSVFICGAIIGAIFGGLTVKSSEDNFIANCKIIMTAIVIIGSIIINIYIFLTDRESMSFLMNALGVPFVMFITSILLSVVTEIIMIFVRKKEKFNKKVN